MLNLKKQAGATEYSCDVSPGLSVVVRLAAVLLISLHVTACDMRQANDEAEAARAPNIVTGDIQAGIEKHIAEQVRMGGGYFKLPFEDKELQLKLVRVHLEYLATLGPRRHFACVDMASSDGEFYDVDFFLEGGRAAMTVTETTVHKLNGKPFYLWKQKPDKTWGREPVSGASKELLGVLTGRDVFEFRYQATLPDMAGTIRLWLPLASTDDFQKVTVRAIRTPKKPKILKDSVHGNQVLYLELGAEDSGKTLEIVYEVERSEKSAYKGDPEEAKLYLKADRMVPVDDKLRALAEKAVAGRQGDLMRARALYDNVIDRMRYMKYGKGWGNGDAVFACSARYGNCTDFHSYFIGLARSVGIPARFAIGAAIPSERNDGATDGYHCWAEFYAEGKWWPVDISEANKFSALSMYYFGHHPANRFEFTRGRDLAVTPKPVSGPINFLAYPLLEVDGEPQKVKTLFLFKRKPGSS